MAYRWGAPDEVEKGLDVTSLDNDKLEFYHDQMHIFWKKIEEGLWFDWTFKEVYFMHKSIVIEMLKRNLKHIHPINDLDRVEFVKDMEELTKVIKYIKQKK
jgi:hypothetical protein